MDVKFGLITAIFLVSAVGVKGVEDNFTFGGCVPGKESCQDCYLTLVKSLLGNGENVMKLTNAFFPPNMNPPDVVIVTYHFRNDSTNETKSCNWFWATTFGYFLYPLKHFQFLSLLFGKPTPLYHSQQAVDVTLDAECLEAGDDFMLLLTKRLRGYIKQQSVYARFDESRGTAAVNRASFNKTIEDYGNDATKNLVTTFGITYPLVIVTTVSIFVSIQFAMPYYVQKKREKDKKRNLTRAVKAAIISFSFISFRKLSSIVVIDILALYYAMNEDDNYKEYERIHYEDEVGRPHSILYHSGVPLIIIDVLALIAHIVTVITVIFLMHCSLPFNRQSFCRRKQKAIDRDYYILALTLFYSFVSIAAHSPYIAIAYLNDSIYAGSVFIFYTIVTIVEFIVLELTFVSWFKLNAIEEQDTPSSRKEATSIPIKDDTPSSNEELEAATTCFSFVCCQRYTSFICIIVCSLLPIYCLAAVSVCFFYYLPINHSISTASNQIIIVYQTALVFLGAVILYKTVFKRKDPLIKALDNCKDEDKNKLLESERTTKWQTITDQEKLVIFYKYLTTNVIRKFKYEDGAEISDKNQEFTSDTYQDGEETGTPTKEQTETRAEGRSDAINQGTTMSASIDDSDTLF